MMCTYTVEYHDYAVIPIGETASPDVNVTVQENVSLKEASTAIVSEAAKFMNELGDAGQSAFIDWIESTFIVVKYYEGKIDRYRCFYFENCYNNDGMEDYED